MKAEEKLGLTVDDLEGISEGELIRMIEEKENGEE